MGKMQAHAERLILERETDRQIMLQTLIFPDAGFSVFGEKLCTA